MKETENFKFGMETVSNYGPLSMIWTKFIKEHYNKYTETIEDIIKKGKIAKKYSANINKEYCKNFAYVTEIEGNKCIVLNKKDLTLNQNCDIIDLKKSFNKYIQEKVQEVNEKYQVSVNMQYSDYYKYIFK